MTDDRAQVHEAKGTAPTAATDPEAMAHEGVAATASELTNPADPTAPADRTAAAADATTTAAAADATTTAGEADDESGRLRSAATSIADAATSLFDAASGLADAASSMAEAAAAPVAGAASSVAGAASSVARPLLREVDELRVEARRRLDERPGARIRRVRRMGARALPNLYELHPEARRASIREQGVQTIAVEEICGTAVEGPVQRGGDFLPTRDRRGSDWQVRWQRIRRATEKLAILPPVELLKLGDCYWVVDGHNRVAAALYNGQVAIDAVVLELRTPGVASKGEPTRIAGYLESTRDIRAAGEGRLSRAAATRPAPNAGPGPRRDDGDDDPAADTAPDPT